MAVLLETSKGDIVIDLYVEEAPNTCKNFLKLCKIKYYNNCLFHNVQRDFIAQTGDPTGTGRGGDSVYGLMYGSQARFFDDEVHSKRKHTAKGTVGMASAGPGLNASQFYFTLSDSLDSLDERHTVFGGVSEGLEVLEEMNEVPVDNAGRPLQNIRIRHSIVLEDPFDDPPQLVELIPDASPEPKFEQGDRLEEDWVPQQDERPQEEIEKEARAAEAQNRAVVLEMIGDLPEADVKPPSNMLFVCKLNPVTSEEDLEIIFSRFGNVTSCDIIRDYKTGDSLCYAFIGYDNDQSCEAAYFKMNNVLIDDRRIKVDFSQSVSHIWKQFKRHGKKGGTVDLAAEAAGHQRGSDSNVGFGGGRGGGRFEQRGGGEDRGLLLGSLVDEQLVSRGTAGRRRDEPAAVAAALSNGGKRSRSRSHSRSKDGSKKHKKEKHKKQKKEKHKSRERSRSREELAVQHVDGRQESQSQDYRSAQQQQHGRHRGEQAAGYRDELHQPYSNSRENYQHQDRYVVAYRRRGHGERGENCSSAGRGDWDRRGDDRRGSQDRRRHDDRDRQHIREQGR